MHDAPLPHKEAPESTSSRIFAGELMDSLKTGQLEKVNSTDANQSVVSNLQELLPNVTFSDSEKQEGSNRPDKFNGKKPPRNIQGIAESSGQSDKEELPLPDKFDTISSEEKRPEDDGLEDKVNKIKDNYHSKHKSNIIGEAVSSDNTTNKQDGIQFPKLERDPQEILASASYENDRPVVISGDQAVVVTPNGRVKTLDPVRRGENRDGENSLRPRTRQDRPYRGPNLEERGSIQDEAFDPQFLRPANEKPNTIKIQK